MTSRKHITLDDLAAMIHRGFQETAKQVEVNRRFGVIEDRLEHIEKLILADHKRRI